MRRALQLALVLMLSLVTGSAKAGDPYLRWYTIETPHFRIHYHGGLEQFAQRVATIAEYVDRTLKPDLDWVPHEVTHVLLTDDSEGANGSANSIPYNTVRLYATAPDDMSVLNDNDDWPLLLMMHEYTHVLHIDNVHGLPAVLNAIFGKRYTPNQEQPRWIIEGLATAMESRHTSAGRVRSTLFDMYLRADVLEGHMLTIDQLSHPMRRFPGISLWYLYGSRFIDWILDTYGPDTFGAVSIDYGQNLIPWGINRSIRRATGATYPQLYAGWKDSLERRYQAQRAAIQARGLREGRRLTHTGGSMSSPRFVPHCANVEGPARAVLFSRRDPHSTAGFYRLDLDRPGSEPVLVTRARGEVASYDAECGIVFGSVAPSRRRYSFGDLFRQAPGTRSPRGFEPGRRRLTVGTRARSPDVSPSGRRVVFVTNHAGTTTLRIADYHPVTGISNTRLLVNKRRYEQVFTPRFSPDGKRVAFGTWLTGGYRDIHIVDVDSGRVTKITSDRAIDQQPSWSPDGRYLYFTSDRTGVANVYAYELSTGELKQVTNVVNGAYMPELSPDGRTLLYVGYTSLGFDLFAMPLEPERFLPALPYVDTRPKVAVVPDEKKWPVRPYTPWPTLRPYSYQLDYGDGAFGKTLTLNTDGTDVTERHAIAAEFSVDLEHAIPQGSLSYGFSGLPMDLSLSAFRSVVPRLFNIGDKTPVVRESVTGMSSGIGYGIPGEYSSQFLAFSYSVNLFDQRLPVAGYLDPYAPVPNEPHHGQLGLVHLGYSFHDTESSTYAIGNEKGWTLDLGLDYASKYTVSDDSLYSVEGRVRAYLLLPWSRHHVLAWALRGGSAGGTYPRRGFFYTGGFSDQAVLDAYTSNLLQSAFVLRGYDPGQFGGNQFVLNNLEYRFPISYVEHGLSTLPVFLGAVSGVVFADFGGAFNRLNYDELQSDLHLGTGAELWVDLTLGYSVENTLRFGVARGFGPPAHGLMKYLVAAARF